MAKQVLIVGGGSGGTILANVLDKRKFDVTVVSVSLEHLFQPGLLYLAFRNAKARLVRDERSLLSRRVNLVHDAVGAVDLNRNRVTLASGGRLSYDYLVMATGTVTSPSEIPGLAQVNAEFGDYHSSVSQAEKLWRHLDGFAGGTIALGQASPICKCPPSPIEGILLTEELLTRRGLRDRARLVFFTPYPRAYPAAAMNEIVEPILKERGIEVMTFFDLDRVDPATRTLHSIEGDQIQYDLPIVVPPFTGVEIAYEPAQVVDEGHFVLTDKVSLRVNGTDNAFAIGDASKLPTSKSGVGAHLEARVVAKTLAGKEGAFNGRTHCPMDVAYGRGTFVIGTYEAPVRKYRPSRFKHLLKAMFGRIYWVSLKGWLEPLFEAYFRLTAPPSAPERGGRPIAAGHA